MEQYGQPNRLCLKDFFGSLFICYDSPMRLFKSKKLEKEYTLIADWLIELEDKYTRKDSGDHAQMYNNDASRVIYGSSFIIDASQEVKDEVKILSIEQDDGGSYSLTASVAQSNNVLAITITYTNKDDEDWAKSVVQSAHLRKA